MSKFQSIAAFLILSLLPTNPGTFNLVGTDAPTHTQIASHFFSETGQEVKGKFLAYWNERGGLSQYGYPISGEMQQRSPLNGRTYTVQYFERAVFELHPENQPPYDVLLSLLGRFYFMQKYPNGAHGQVSNTSSGSVLFQQTSHRVGGSFLNYWRSHGGLLQQGYPISEEFSETSPLNGKVYTVQYFERAVFELHPENKGAPYEILLSRLGAMSYMEKQAKDTQGATTLSIPAPQPARRQSTPRGSDSYLVWEESTEDAQGGSLILDSYNIMGLDLTTGKTVTVTDASCDQTSPAISRAMVVWEAIEPPCSSGNVDIIGKDLETGTEYRIAQGPAHQAYPAIAGKAVVWVETNEKNTQLLMEDIDSRNSVQIRSVGLSPNQSVTTTLYPPQITDEYIVWAELGQSDPATKLLPVHLQAYNRGSGIISTLARYQIRGTSGPEYSIAGHLVAWYDDYDGGLNVVDLGTGESSVYNTQQVLSPLVHDDSVFWSAMRDDAGFDIYGMNLNKGEIVRIVSDKGNQFGVTIAGEWLVWATSGGPNDGHLGSKPLSEVFGSLSHPK